MERREGCLGRENAFQAHQKGQGLIAHSLHPARMLGEKYLPAKEMGPPIGMLGESAFVLRRMLSLRRIGQLAKLVAWRTKKGICKIASIRKGLCMQNAAVNLGSRALFSCYRPHSSRQLLLQRSGPVLFHLQLKITRGDLYDLKDSAPKMLVETLNNPWTMLSQNGKLQLYTFI